MTPSMPASRSSRQVATSPIAPLRMKVQSGKSRLRANAASRFKGGTSRFSLGERPFNHAARECTMKTRQPASRTSPTKSRTKP